MTVIELTDRKTIKESLARVAGESGALIVDMAEVKTIDSAGLGALLKLLHDARGPVALCGLTKPVRAIFELTRLHRVFDIYDDRDEALLAVERVEEEFAGAA